MNKILLASIFFSVPMLADADVVYSNNNSYQFSDCTPSCTPEFQQLYSSSNFSTAQYIDGIQFYYLNGDAQTYTITLSYSNTTVAQGLASSFSQNVGSGSTVFYTGAWVSPNANNVGTFVGATPFLYDPSYGDLLLSIDHATGSASSFSTYIDTPGQVDRNYSFDSGSSYGYGNQSVGLQTTFLTNDISSIPEPSTVLLAASACLALAFSERRPSRRWNASEATDCTGRVGTTRDGFEMP